MINLFVEFVAYMRHKTTMAPSKIGLADIKKSPQVLAPLNDNVNSTSASVPIIQFDKYALNNFADFGDENRENHIQAAPVSLSHNNIQQLKQ